MRGPGGLLVLVALAGACASAPAPAEPMVLRVVMADDWATTPTVREVIDDFERTHSGVSVEVEGASFSRIPALVAAAGRDERPYDLAQWHAFAAAAADLAQPLDEQWEAAGLTEAEFLPGALAHVTWRGRRYGIPLDTNALVLIVNADALAAVGSEPADLRTLDGFVTGAVALTEARTVEHALTISASSWPAYGWIRAHGGELVQIDATSGVPTFTFDDPDTLAALDLLHDLVRDGHAPPLYTSNGSLDAVQAFAHGAVAMHTSGSWDLPVIARTASDDLDVTVLPLPQADPDARRTVLGGSSLFVPVGSPHADLAFDLMLRLTDDPVALRLAEEEGRLPARGRVFDDDLFTTDPLLAAVVAELPHADVMPLIAYPEVAEAFSEALEDILTGRTAPAEAMRRVQAFGERWQAGTTGRTPRSVP